MTLHRSTPAGSHLPVMLAEVLTALDPQPGETVVDCTLGAGGHATELLKRVGPTGRLIACDLDPRHLDEVRPRLEAIRFPFELHQSNFAALPTIAPLGAHAVLADLGVSSMQIDDAERGFSYRRDGPLDMRMDSTRGKTVAAYLQSTSAADLETVFAEWGDFSEFGPGAAKKLAQAIVTHRDRQPLRSTRELTELILATIPPPLVPIGKKIKPWQLKYRPVACAFQALRIAVNRELANLEALLRSLPTVLKPGGRVAIISFHSGEDRLVKASFRARLQDGTYADLSDEPIRPPYQERIANPRSRSAKLRWARRSAI